jgi:hypothetical protein
MMAIFFVFINPLSKKILNKKLMSDSNSVASTGSHGKYIKFVNFPWPAVVAAHDRKRLARALPISGSYWRYKIYPNTQNSVRSIRTYHSLQTAQKTISDHHV